MSRRSRSNLEGSRHSIPSRPSAPPSNSNGEEMGMSLERQREIQASLFRMLGQADDVPTRSDASSSGKSSSQTSSVSRQSGQTSERNGVGHATTFPPRQSSGSSTKSSTETLDTAPLSMSSSAVTDGNSSSNSPIAEPSFDQSSD